MTSLLLTLTTLALTGCLDTAKPDEDGRIAPTLDDSSDIADDTNGLPTGEDTAVGADGGTDTTAPDTDATDTAPPGETASEPSHAAPWIGAVVITEVMAHPSVTADADGEWIEVTNATDEALSLEDCVLWQQPSFTCELLEDGGGPILMEPGAILTLCVNTDQDSNGGVPCDGRYVSPKGNSDCGLGNSGDTLGIKCDGDYIDTMEYGETQLLEGASLGLDPSAISASDNDNAYKWCPQVSPLRDGDFGTPGVENDSCF